MLRSTGKSVQLKLVRYLHGFKFEQLQQAIANSTNPLASSYIRSNSSSNILHQDEDEFENLPQVPPVNNNIGGYEMFVYRAESFKVNI